MHTLVDGGREPSILRIRQNPRFRENAPRFSPVSARRTAYFQYAE